MNVQQVIELRSPDAFWRPAGSSYVCTTCGWRCHPWRDIVQHLDGDEHLVSGCEPPSR